MTIKQERVWGAHARIKREQLSRDLVTEMEKMAEAVMANVEDPKIRDGVAGFYGTDILEKGIKIRKARLTAQRITAGVYLGMALIGLFAPLVDIVGLLEFGRSENSLFASSMIYFSSWLTIGLLKVASTSTKTIRMMEDVVSFMKSKVNDVVTDKAEPKTLQARLNEFDQGIVGIRAQCRSLFAD